MSKNAVATTTGVTGNAVSTILVDEFEGFAGLGMDQVRTEDMSIPFLRVLAVAFKTAGHEQRPGRVVAILGGGGHGRSEREQQPSDDREPATDRQR
jgi:hypothetical protein